MHGIVTGIDRVTFAKIVSVLQPAQVSEGGRAAVRSDVRLRVSLSALPRFVKHSYDGSASNNGDAKGVASSGAIAAPGSYRPIFTVSALPCHFMCWCDANVGMIHV